MPRKKATAESYDDLVRQLTKLAKRADQRMVRLEQAEGQRGYEHITSFSYSKAEAEIERFSGQLKEGQKPRWNRATPKTKQEVQAKIAAINRFLESETSTKSGVKEGYKRRAETLKDRLGIDVAWQDLGKFFKSPAYQKLISVIPGSHTAVKTLAKIQRNKDAILNAIKEGSVQNLDIPDFNGPLEDKIKKYIEQNEGDVIAFLIADYGT